MERKPARSLPGGLSLVWKTEVHEAVIAVTRRGSAAKIAMTAGVPPSAKPIPRGTEMTVTIRQTLPISALVLLAGLSIAGAARADDAMKPADAMKSGGMMTTDDAATADCKEKAGMESDQMKKDEAMKACDDMMKSGAMGSDTMKSDDAMKPAQSN
jgi:pentapeptide MXKDX repeat protein